MGSYKQESVSESLIDILIKTLRLHVHLQLFKNASFEKKLIQDVAFPVFY